MLCPHASSKVKVKGCRLMMRNLLGMLVIKQLYLWLWLYSIVLGFCLQVADNGEGISSFVCLLVVSCGLVPVCVYCQTQKDNHVSFLNQPQEGTILKCCLDEAVLFLFSVCQFSKQIADSCVGIILSIRRRNQVVETGVCLFVYFVFVCLFYWFGCSCTEVC